MKDIKDQEIPVCQEKIMELEQHLANRDKTINVLRGAKIRLEDEVEDLKKENLRLRGA